MIYALILALLSGPTSVGVSLHLFTRYMAARDAQDASERAQLAQRIQAPETAVAQHVVTTGDNTQPYLPWEDDQAFMTYQNETSPNRAG